MTAGTASLAKLRELGTHVGQDLGVIEFAITPERVRWYIDALGDDHPWYTGPPKGEGPVYQGWSSPSASMYQRTRSGVMANSITPRSWPTCVPSSRSFASDAVPAVIPHLPR